MRTFNARLALMLLAGMAILWGAVVLAHGFQVRRIAGAFREYAERAGEDAKAAKEVGNRAEEGSKAADASRYYRYYLNLRPDAPDAPLVLQTLGVLLADTATDRVSLLRAANTLDEAVRRLEVGARRLEEEVQKLEAAGKATDDAKLAKAREQAAELRQRIPETRRKLVDVNLKLVRVLRQLSFLTDARLHIEHLLKSAPDDAELLELYGQCLLGLGQEEEALKAFQQAVAAAPNRLETYALLAGLLHHRLNKPKEAEDYMIKMIEGNPQSVKARLVYCHFLLRSNSVEKAAVQAAKAIELAPNDSEALLASAHCALAQQRYEEAAKLLEQGIKSEKDRALMYTVLAEVRLRSVGPEEAMAVYKRGLEATKDTAESLPIYVAMAQLCLDLRRIPEAKEAISKLPDLEGYRELIRYLEGQVDYIQGHWAAARRTLESVRDDLEARPEMQARADSIIGDCYGHLGNAEQQLSAYRRALRADSGYVPARIGIADHLRAAGQLTAAADDYRKIISSGRRGHMMALLPLIETLVLQNQRLAPDERKWDEIDRLLDQAAKTMPDVPRVHLLRVDSMLPQNKFEEAERLLRELLEKDPKRAEYWRALILVTQRQEKWDEAEKLRGEAEKQLGDVVPLRLARAAYLLRRYRTQAGPDLRKLTDGIEKFERQEQAQLLSALIGFSSQAGDTEQALALCRRLVTLRRSDLSSRFLLFQLTLRARGGQDRAALCAELEPILKEIHDLGGRTPEWLYGQALCLLLQPKKAGGAEKEEDARLLDEASKFLQEARQMRPDWSQLLLLAGNIAYSRGRLEEALESYQQAIRRGEVDSEPVSRAAQILFQSQRYAEVDQLLRRLDERDSPAVDNLCKLWADACLRMGDFDRAAQIARKSAAAAPKSHQEQLWLGQVLGQAGLAAMNSGRAVDADRLRQDAEKAYRRAVELDPRAPASWVALVRFLADIGAAEKAQEAVAQAEKQIARYIIHMAMCYEAVGEASKALKNYEEALKNVPDNPHVIRSAADFYLRVGKRQSAKPLLEKIRRGDVKEPDRGVLAWANRKTAEILADGRDFPGLKKALQLVDANLASPAAAIDDLRLKAKLQLADPRRIGLDEAVKTLESLVKSGGATAEDRFTLAQLYLRKGDFSRYRSQMSNVLKASHNDPRYLRAYVQTLLQRNETAEADRSLPNLEKSTAAHFDITSLRADLLFRQKEYGKALGVLAKFVDSKDAEPKDQGERMRLAAGLLEQFADRLRTPPPKEARPKEVQERKLAAAEFASKAESLYRAYVVKQPAQAVLLAAFLSRQGQFVEATQLMEQFVAKADSQTVVQVALPARLVFRSGAASRQQIQRVEKLVETALAKSNGAIPLLDALADACIRQERFQDAEASYRKILGKAPDSVVAMNNLAVLLAARKNRLDEALKLIDAAMAIAGPVGAMLDSRATVYIARNEPDNALADLEQALAEDETPVRRFHQARAFLLAGRKGDARSALEAAFKAGLQVTMLDPPERPEYDSLRTELNPRE